MYFLYIAPVRLNLTNQVIPTQLFLTLIQFLMSLQCQRAACVSLFILINHNGLEGNLCNRSSFICKGNVMLMRTSKNTTLCCRYFGFSHHHITQGVQRRQSQSVTQQTKQFCGRGMQILSDFLRQRSKKGKKQRKEKVKKSLLQDKLFKRKIDSLAID